MYSSHGASRALRGVRVRDKTARVSAFNPRGCALENRACVRASTAAHDPRRLHAPKALRFHWELMRKPEDAPKAAA